MARARTSRMPAFGIFIVAAVATGAGLAEAQTPGERTEQGRYSLERAATPEFLVTGIALDPLTAARAKGMETITEGLAGRFGRTRTLFNRETNEQIKLTVAAYGSVAEAEDAALALLNSVSMVLPAVTDPGAQIGTHTWRTASGTGAGVVVYVHNNVLVQLFSSDSRLADQSARSIAEDLRLGQHGVSLGKEVLLPRVTEVNVPTGVMVGKESVLTLDGDDPSGRPVSFVVAASRGQVMGTPERNVEKYTPSAEGADELQVYAINDRNVVSRVYAHKVKVAGGR